MKKVFLVSLIAVIFAFGFTSGAYAYLLNDWGVTPGSNWSPIAGVLSQVTPGSQVPGYGGHPFDAEAMYIYRDTHNAYIAVVSGMPQTGSPSWSAPAGQNIYPGDFAINFGGARDVNNNLIYQYGVRVSSNGGSGGFGTPGGIYDNIAWGTTYDWGSPYVWGGQNNPTVIEGGNLIGTAGFNYYALTGADALEHYVYEATIPLNTVGMDFDLGGTIHWSMTCGNDALNVNFPRTVTPEPVSSALFLLGGGAMIVKRFRKKSK